MAGLDILSSTRARLRTSNHGRILFEMALVRLGRLDDLVSLTQLAQVAASGQVAAPSGLSAADIAKKKPLTHANSAPAPPAPPPPRQLIGLTVDSLPVLWAQVLAQLGQIHRNDLENGGFPAISGPNALVIRFPARYNAARDRCQDPEKIGGVEQLLLKLTGQKCHLRIESGDDSPNAVASARATEDGGGLQSRSLPTRDEVVEPPLVKWARDLLGAKPIKADPGFGASTPACVERAATADAEES
jgi:DNA polymerase-3 subunit gamma/tau